MPDSPKDESDQLWEEIRKSPFASTYLMEVHQLAHRVVTACDSLFQLTEPITKRPADQGVLKVDHESLGGIIGLLADATRLRNLVEERPKGSKQNPKQHAIQQKRMGWLRDVLSGLSVKTICSVQVRNSVSHFDEYLDEVAMKGVQGELGLPLAVPLDFIVGARNNFEVILKKHHWVLARVYVVDEQIFINFDREISLGALHDECAAIVDRLAGSVPDPTGSGILILSEGSASQP